MGFRSSMGTYLRNTGLQTLQMILALAYVPTTCHLVAISDNDNRVEVQQY